MSEISSFSIYVLSQFLENEQKVNYLNQKDPIVIFRQSLFTILKLFTLNALIK